jgi:hypothetical protein
MAKSEMTTDNMKAQDDRKLSGLSHVEDSMIPEAAIAAAASGIEDTKPSTAVWLITFTVAMGGFLFGMCRQNPATHDNNP